MGGTVEEKLAVHEAQVNARLEELTATVSAQFASFGRSLSLSSLSCRGYLSIDMSIVIFVEWVGM